MGGVAQTDNCGNFSAHYSLIKDVIFRIRQACVILAGWLKMRGGAVASWERAVVWAIGLYSSQVVDALFYQQLGLVIRVFQRKEVLL